MGVVKDKKGKDEKMRSKQGIYTQLCNDLWQKFDSRSLHKWTNNLDRLITIGLQKSGALIKLLIVTKDSNTIIYPGAQ